MHRRKRRKEDTGWAWQVRATSSLEAPYSTARTASEIISPAFFEKKRGGGGRKKGYKHEGLMKGYKREKSVIKEKGNITGPIM